MSRKISFGCDHRGFEIKKLILDYLLSRGYKVLDCGTNSSDSVDYTDYALAAATKLSQGECDAAIVVCYTGIGSSIAANKVPGVRASLVEDVKRSELTRAHNDSNMLILASGFLDRKQVIPIIEKWLDTPFEGGRHSKRVEKITEYEKRKG